jgi:hypothetical protein
MYDGKVILYTNFYRFQTIMPYCNSLVKTLFLFHKLGIKCDYEAIRGDFHVERAINHSLTKFLNDDEATDFFIIDSDESWEAEDVVRILNRPEEVVGATYMLKNDEMKYVAVFNSSEDGYFVGKILDDGNALLEALRVPAGFLRVRKSALQKVVDKNPDDYFVIPDGRVYRFFWNEILNGNFIGMDYAFSDKLRDAGVQLWIDPMVKINHWGINEWKGDLDKELRDLKAYQDAQGAE